MNVAQKTVLITGANRGLGRALVDEALKRGARRVYAGTRGPWQHADRRVTSLTLDVTSAADIQRAATRVDAVDLLINNAGISLPDDLSDPAMIEQHLAVNLLGPFNVTQAFSPLVKRAKGAIVNVLSLAAIAPVPIWPAYGISKAAMSSLTQSLRMFLARDGVSVHAAFLGPVDTDMIRDFDLPKTPPEAVAAGIFDGLERGEEDIFPDPMSQSVADAWRNSINKELERQFAGYMPPAH